MHGVMQGMVKVGSRGCQLGGQGGVRSHGHGQGGLGSELRGQADLPYRLWRRRLANNQLLLAQI